MTNNISWHLPLWVHVFESVISCDVVRALCRIKLLLFTHVLVDTWMLTVKPVYKLSNVSDDLKWTINTQHDFYSLSRHN